MNKRGFSSILVVALLVGTCQTFLTPQIANAGSVNFGTNGDGTPTGGTVTVPYNAKFDLGNGAFNLEMWVKESSRVGYENGVRVTDQQYQAQFFRGTKLFNWDDRVNQSSWGVGVSFDGNHMYVAPEVGKYPTPTVYTAGTDTDYSDPASSNTKNARQVLLLLPLNIFVGDANKKSLDRREESHDIICLLFGKH
jgi:hypothetical protein